MLRITTDSRADRLVLTLEGRLAGPWVAEAESHWAEAKAVAGDRTVVVDLREVLGLDRDGRALLVRMQHAGASFLACGCAMREIVREVSDAGRRRDASEEGSRT